MQDLHTDSKNLLAMVTDQVARLSRSDSQTRKAVEIFGLLGLVTEPTQVRSPDGPSQGKITSHTLPKLWQHAILTYLRTTLTNAATTIIDNLTTLAKNLGTHGFLLTLLAISTIFHLLTSSAFVQTWYHERHAANYMSRLGITPDTTMAKAVYLHDLTGITHPPTLTPSNNATNACLSTFNQLLSPTTNSASAISHDYSHDHSISSTARRLHKTRERLATYRHDLLVSLRLVNSIERETVQAEYENWILEESRKCEQIQGVLDDYAKAGKKTEEQGMKDSASGNMTRGAEIANHGKSREFVEKLRELQKGYCGDCRMEREELERKLI